MPYPGDWARDQPGAPEPRRGDLYPFRVAGVRFYSGHVARLTGVGEDAGFARVAVEARINLEEGNPHDAGAVRVDVDGSPVGYFPRDHARRFREFLGELENPSLWFWADGELTARLVASRGVVAGVRLAVDVGGSPRPSYTIRWHGQTQPTDFRDFRARRGDLNFAWFPNGAWREMGWGWAFLRAVASLPGRGGQGQTADRRGLFPEWAELMLPGLLFWVGHLVGVWLLGWLWSR